MTAASPLNRKPVNHVLLTVPVAKDCLEVHLLSLKCRHGFSVVRMLKSNPVVEAVEFPGIQLKPVQGRVNTGGALTATDCAWISRCFNCITAYVADDPTSSPAPER